MKVDKRQQELILAVAAAIALAFVGYMIFLGPALAKRAARQQPVTTPVTTTNASAVIPADAETKAAAERAIPASSSFAGTKRALLTLARTYRVELTLNDTSGATPTTVSPQLTMTATATGQWSLLLPFLIKLGTMTNFDDSHQIRSNGQLYLIPSLSLAPKSAQSQLYAASFTLIVPSRSA